MNSPTPMPKRIQRTAKAIEAAGLKLFAASPVDAVAIDDIVKEADVSKGSFYNHYVDKSALLDSIVTYVRAGLEAQVNAANMDVGDPAVRIARAISVYAQHALDEPASTRVLIRVETTGVKMENLLNQGLIGDVSKGMAEQRFSICSLEAGVLMVAGITRIIVARISERPESSDARPLTLQMCAMLLHGFGVGQSEAQAIATKSVQFVMG